MPAPTITLRGDLTGTAFGVAPTYTDYTSFLETGADGAPIGITWGRQDKDSEVQVTTFSFILNNTDGRFTSGASIITTAHQFNVRVTHNAVTYDRVSGYVESVDIVWPGQVGSFSTVRVTCVDVSSRLADAQPLRSFLEYAILADSPGAFWPATEPEGGLLVGNIATTPRTAGVLVASKFGPNAYGLGGDPVLEDEATSFTTECTTDSGDFKGAGIQLPAGVLTAAPFTIELMFRATPGSGNGSQTLLQFTRGLSINDFTLQVALTPAIGAVTFYVQGDSDSGGSGNNVGTGAFPVYNYTDSLYHHLVVGLESDGFTPFMYLDGVAQTSLNTPTASALALVNLRTATPFIGLPNTTLGTGGSWTYCPGLNGQAGMIAFYPGVRLSAGTIATHYTAATGRRGERTDQRFTKVAALGGITTTGLPTGLGTMGPQQISGRPAVTVLREVARTEGGPLLVTGAGALTFQARNARYNPAPAFSVSANELNPDLLIRRDRDGLTNDQTYARYHGGQVRFFDQASITSYGRRDGNGATIAPLTDEDARLHAAWDVLIGKDPQTRMASVTADLLTQPTTALVASLLAATVSTAFTVTGLPTQTPGGTSMGLFVEGGQESIGAKSWSLTLYTSPTASIPATLVVGTGAANNQLDAGIKVAY